MSSRPTVLITGASGFVGSHVVEHLSAAGTYDVIAVDLAPSDLSAHLGALPGVEFIAMDIRDMDALGKLLDRSTHIIHLAAVRTKASLSNPRASFDFNVGYVFDLLTLAKRHGIRRLVFGSTHCVYGSFARPAPGLIDETALHECTGIDMYGASKRAGEALCEAFQNSGGIEYLALRLGAIYGPRTNRDNIYGGPMLDIVSAAAKGERIELDWSRDSTHSMIYVADVAAAFAAALDVRESGMAINVLGSPLSSTEFFEACVEQAGGNASDIQWQETRRRYHRASPERMQKVLGLSKLTPLDKGLAHFVAWARALDREAGRPHTPSHSGTMTA